VADQRRLSIQRILQDHFAEYRAIRQLPGYVEYAARRMIACRTAAMGGHVESCPNGHVHNVWYNSCKHRACPQCAELQIEQWLDRQRARILACDHYHTIFTVPEELNPLWERNRKWFADLLFASVRDTLQLLLGDPKYLGAQPGMIMAMHTWGRTLIEHPHIHCLVTGGGLTEAGRWASVRKSCLLPRKVVMIIFRGKLLDALRKAADAGRLRLPEGMRLSVAKGLLNKLGRQVWNVKIQERYTHVDGVLTYLARYLRGGPITNRRLLSCADGRVRFRYQDHHDADATGKPRSKVLELSVGEFLRRLLAHIPKPGSQMVRNYGLYASAKAEELDRARGELHQAPVVRPELVSWEEFLERLGHSHATRCPVCGAQLVRHGDFPRSKGPPRVATGLEHIA
jgi:hypothetical protein